MASRYLLDSDDDGHWYLIKVGCEDNFRMYVESDDVSGFPVGVISLGSHPNTVTFESPQHFGQPVTDSGS
jgi:hypothetical protein